MLLENRVLWGAFASVGDPTVSLRTIIDSTSDVAGASIRRTSSDIQTARCSLTTSVQYTQDAALLKRCAVPRTSGAYSFDFLCSEFSTAERSYYCFLVPFRRMLGGLLSRVRTALRGRDCVWNRLEIMRTGRTFPSTQGIAVPSCHDFYFVWARFAFVGGKWRTRSYFRWRQPSSESRVCGRG